MNVKNTVETDSRKIWSTVKPFFSDTIKTVNNIILSDNEKMFKDENKTAKTLNSFENHTSTGKIKRYNKDELSSEFKQFSTTELLKIKELPSNKTSVLNDIPIKIIKSSD